MTLPLFSKQEDLHNYFEQKSIQYQKQQISFLSSSKLKELLQISISSPLLSTLKKKDPSKPYGRQVLYLDNLIEIMIATWTPDVMCVPHDHGGSWSTIAVLEGCSKHELYKIIQNQLQLVYTEECPVGTFIQCVPSQIHAMGDAGKETSTLVTLHAYSKSIPYMMVYDKPKNKTFQVNGNCGAWIPDQAQQILQQYDGILQ